MCNGVEVLYFLTTLVYSVKLEEMYLDLLGLFEEVGLTLGNVNK